IISREGLVISNLTPPSPRGGGFYWLASLTSGTTLVSVPCHRRQYETCCHSHDRLYVRMDSGNTGVGIACRRCAFGPRDAARWLDAPHTRHGAQCPELERTPSRLVTDSCWFGRDPHMGNLS